MQQVERKLINCNYFIDIAQVHSCFQSNLIVRATYNDQI